MLNFWSSRRVLIGLIALSGMCIAQTDPGPRGGPPGAGGFFPALNSTEQQFFNQAQSRFGEADSVSGTIESGVGLGPTFNGNSCAMCHAQPAMGGSSPAVNPQVALAKLHHASPDPFPQIVPSFITANGPVRETRFVLNPDGSLDGGVHGLYTIAGRSDAPGCTLAQPNFAHELANHNVIFRIPTPVFGLGLVENTPDATLMANLSSTAAQRAVLGIAGTFNTSGNDGSITRFGWKAQNKSLLIFAGEAYNVEQGVSNEIFPNERSAVPGCVFNPSPEDSTNLINGTASQTASDTVNFAAFARLLAPPTPTATSSSELNGQTLFTSVGCALCHSTSLTTAQSPFTGMSTFTYHPYSDFALHHMGPGLADGIHQGAAGADEFRTAPLWGAGQRLFFLHDGRTSNLLQAIGAHASGNDQCYVDEGSMIHLSAGWCHSEANKVIEKFNDLKAAEKQDILNFLRSL